MEFIYNILLPLAVTALAAGSILFVGGLILRFVRYIQAGGNTTPAIDAVFNALLPLLYQAIFNGEKLANQFLDDGAARLDSVNRKAIADSLYDMLPAEIVVAGRRIPTSLIKLLVPREMFQTWVKTVYDQALAAFLNQRAYLAKQVEREIGAKQQTLQG